MSKERGRLFPVGINSLNNSFNEACAVWESAAPASSASVAAAVTSSAEKPAVPTAEPITMKLWLCPKSIECQLIKRISNGDDQGIVRDICMPRSDSQRRIVIACCQDFSSLLDTTTLCANFKKLYDMWAPSKYHIEIRRFSFKDEIERMTELLNAATIFYMAGVHGRHRTTPIDVATEHIQQLVARLKQKMHQNEIAYIGICGGAMLAGKFTEFPHVPFDLLEGTIVCYDSSVGPEHISEMKTDVIKDIVQITSGCAIAVVLTTDNRRAVSFPTVKNNAK